MSNINYIKHTLYYASQHSQFILVLLLFTLTDVVLPVMTSHITILITKNGDISLAIYLLILRFVTESLSMYVSSPILLNIALHVKTISMKYAYKKYAALSPESKRIKTSTEFKEAVDLYVNSLYALIDWGLINLFTLTGNVIVVLYVFYNKEMFLQLFMAILVFSLTYYLGILNKQNKLTILDKTYKLENQTLYAKIQMYLIPFQYQEYTVNDITDKCEQIYNNSSSIYKQNMLINNFTSSTNSIISVIICYMSMVDVPNFLLMTIIMNQLSSSITQSMFFLNQYNRYKNDYDNFVNFFDDVTYQNKVEKLYIQESGITLTDLNIHGAKYSITIEQPITIKKGSKILVTGPTGHGKSSFIKSLFGQMVGATLSHGNPSSYYHTVADYYQEIKEKMPSTKVSLRDFFKGEEDDNVVEEYLKLAWTNEEYNRILAQIKFSNKSKGCAFDLAINEVLSGGQKSRLILWSRCYQLDNLHKQILVLDEPIPDVDYDTFIKTIKLIFERYDNGSTIIIMVAHLCDCRKKDLEIVWDSIIQVSNGLVKLVL